ncbi:MAG: ATP-binding protein [Saprospiraceae bacterium]|nr:ATP-binding protein [Bacteroidia bacterium]NNE16662.1 ATP-binding protein [Saprospiraceae bacterium]NNL92359.1 ATP-binding protein [Saprospiraceae bacterium]
MTEELELTIKSSPCQIKYVEDFVKNLMCKCKFDQEVYDNILISLTEAVNNAIIHGNKTNNKKLVRVNCTEKTRKVVISISDEGEGFNPKKIKDPTLLENIECCGGRGVFIMKQLSDEIQFLDEGRTVELHFRTA